MAHIFDSRGFRTHHKGWAMTYVHSTGQSTGLIPPGLNSWVGPAQWGPPELSNHQRLSTRYTFIYDLQANVDASMKTATASAQSLTR